MNQNLNHMMSSLRADKAKWGSLCLFMALGLLLWGRILLKDVPRVVTATDELTSGVVGLDLGEMGEVTSGGKRGPQAVEMAIPSRIKRDLFGVNPRYFEVIDADTEKVSVQAKSSEVTVDDGNGKGQRVSRDAERLNLQSTLLGEAPRALVNGQLLEVGQMIEGFTLLEVGGRQARLQKDGVVVVLKMKTP